METHHTETVVEKAVNFVKDVLGVPHNVTPVAQDDPEHPDTAPEVTAENAMRLNPNPYIVDTAGQITPGTYVAPTNKAPPIPETHTERLRRELDEYPGEKSASELNAESAWHEDNG